MNRFETQSDPVEQPAEVAVELSAEEQEVLARISKQARSRRNRLRRPPNNQPPSWIFGWGGCW
jgi:hypothetical protein